MKFGVVQFSHFGVKNGTYSPVTAREYGDSQITITGDEAELVIKFFGKDNINVGNVQSNKSLSAKNFRLYPSGQNITLNVVYPKPNKPELRLYLSKQAGFKPKGGCIWFLFVSDNAIWIGAMSEQQWRLESSGFKRDESDDVYQDIVNGSDEIRTARLKTKDIYLRDRKLALKRMVMSDFVCEFDEKHKLFDSRFTHKPYVEVHHLIPMSLQKQFSKPLDTIHNIFCLCPRCHRAVHHATEPLTKEIIKKLSNKRPVLDDFSLSINDLYRFYAVEEIL